MYLPYLRYQLNPLNLKYLPWLIHLKYRLYQQFVIHLRYLQ